MGEPFCSLSRVRKLGTSSSHFVPDSQRMPDTNKQRVRMLSERLFSIHKFLLELLRNRVTTSQKHCTAVSMLLNYDIGMPSTTSKCYGSLWKNVSIPFEWRSQRLALVLTALALELKKEGIDDTVCRCIVFYFGGEKKARQVFGAKKM